MSSMVGHTQSANSNNNFNTTNFNTNNNNEFAALHMEMFDFLCIFHRVKRIQSKDTTQCGQLQEDRSLSAEQRAEQLNRSLYKILIEIEAKIAALPASTTGFADTVPVGYFDEWSILCWSLLSMVNRLESDADTANLLDYGGKHYKEKIHTALVELVNKAHRMQAPPSVQPNDQQFERFYQTYVAALISLHELYTLCQQKCMPCAEFEAHLANFKKHLVAALALQRDFANCHGNLLWRKLREHQIHRMTHYGYDNHTFMDAALSFYAHMLYNLGVLGARIQGFFVEIRVNKLLASTGPKLVRPLLDMVYGMADVLLGDSIVCLEPSVNPILVTNNLFPMKIVSLCRFCFFRDFSLQIVSEEVAQQIQQEMRHRKTFDPPSPIRKTPSAALLAMKPASGVKRNNAKASEEGGNTAHKKSDVNSREWISIPPLYDAEHNGWGATYPHLLCTTRQKDSLLDARSAMQTGKRPLFYFHVRAELFSFAGTLSTAHTLSLPFTIATRRNQDCQVQRMMSSYTATCFWLYGTNVLDGLLMQWHDGEIDWKHFKLLYSLYFAMNAEVKRTFIDEDFTILQHKMHCAECGEGFRVSFKNVLCPHLHFSGAKCDLRFSVWRGMLDLLHLFNDAKTETRRLWECGLLLGLMEMKTVHALLRTLPGSGLAMRLSLVAGACVCITVKCVGGELLDLEPLDVKRLQAKNLYDYLQDIILAEKVDFVLDANHEWLHGEQVMRSWQMFAPTDAAAVSAQNASATAANSPPPKTREIVSNVLHTGSVEMEHKIIFTTMRVAVVTCKSHTTDHNNEPDDEFGEHNATNKCNVPSNQQQHTAAAPPPPPSAAATDELSFEQQLLDLLRSHGKSVAQATEVLARLSMDNNNNNVPPPVPLLTPPSHNQSHPISSSATLCAFRHDCSSSVVSALDTPTAAAAAAASSSGPTSKCFLFTAAPPPHPHSFYATTAAGAVHEQHHQQQALLISPSSCKNGATMTAPQQQHQHQQNLNAVIEQNLNAFIGFVPSPLPPPPIVVRSDGPNSANNASSSTTNETATTVVPVYFSLAPSSTPCGTSSSPATAAAAVALNTQQQQLRSPIGEMINNIKANDNNNNNISDCHFPLLNNNCSLFSSNNFPSSTCWTQQTTASSSSSTSTTPTTIAPMTTASTTASLPTMQVRTMPTMAPPVMGMLLGTTTMHPQQLLSSTEAMNSSNCSTTPCSLDTYWAGATPRLQQIIESFHAPPPPPPPSVLAPPFSVSGGRADDDPLQAQQQTFMIVPKRDNNNDTIAATPCQHWENDEPN